MQGLMLKDYSILKRNGRMILLFLVVYGGMMLYSGQIGFLTGFVQVYAAILMFSSFTYDDFIQWNKYARTLPLTDKEIVGAKYTLYLLLTGLGFVLSCMFLGLGVALNKVDDLMSVAVTFWGSTCACVLFGALLIPLAIRFGAEKGRIMMVLAFALMGAFIAAVGIIGDFGSGFGALPSPVLLICAVLAISLTVFYLSFRLSVGIYKKKEY